MTGGRNAPAEWLITLTYVRVCSFRPIPVVVTNPEFLFEPRAETEQRTPWSVLLLLTLCPVIFLEAFP